MKILITGGAGFIGSHLTEYFLKKGEEVVLVDNFSSGSMNNIAHLKKDPALQIISADLLNWDDMDDIIASCDHIYHFAAVVGVLKVLANPLAVMQVNVEGTARLLESIAKVNPTAKTLIASSSEVYGIDYIHPFKESQSLDIHFSINPRSTYIISKLANEFYAMSHIKENNLNIIVARLFNTIGKKQTGFYGMVVPNFINQAVDNEAITVYGDGQQSRSFCDIRDTINVFDLLMQNNDSFGRIVNVGNNREINMNELANMIKTRAHSNSDIVHIPYEEAYDTPYEDTLKRRPDISELKALTNIQFRWTLEETIDSLIQDAKNKRIL